MKLFKSLVGDCAIAFTFLTRIRIPGAGGLQFSPENLVGSTVFYPLVGLVYGLVSAGLVLAGSALQFDPTLTAFVLLLVPFLLNRFLHFDGLCDVLDGFLADRTPVERLAIMKDSRNGSFAMGGSILFLLGKYLILLNLLETGLSCLAVLVVAPVLSRWIMVPMAYKAAYPRPQGTAQAIVGLIGTKVLAAASLVMLGCLSGGLAFAMLVDGRAAILPVGSLVLQAGLVIGVGWFGLLGWLFWLRRLAGRKIGGVTGDVLGCLCESGELIFLVAAFAVLHGLAAS